MPEKNLQWLLITIFVWIIVDELNNEFSKQKSLYKVGQQPVAELEKYKQIAMGYAEMENAVSVLSDMHTNVSYVYYGRFSQVFGWNRENGTEEKIDSIWEEKILKQIHPDDLRDKYLQELRFFHFVRRQPKTKRTDFYLANKLRIKMRRETISLCCTGYFMFLLL